MSTRSAVRKRPQKHQNKTAWKPNKFGGKSNDAKTKVLSNVVVTNCCEKCTGIIQWKLEYALIINYV